MELPPTVTGYRATDTASFAYYASKEDAERALSILPTQFANTDIKGPIVETDYDGRYVGMYEVQLVC